MPLIQLNHVQEYLGQEMMNRYFYFTGSTISVGILNDCADAFALVIAPLVNRLQVNTVQNLRIDTRELEGINFSTRVLTGTGMNSGEESPSWNALSFILSRGNASTKSGGKRIGGISEANIIGNQVFPDPTFEGWLADYANAMDNILLGSLGNYVPSLVKFDPLNPGQVLANQPIAGAAFTKLSTQNTRKPEI